MYRFGYDFTSTSLVHPLLTTGGVDYRILIGEMDISDMKISYEIMGNIADTQIKLMAIGLGCYDNQRAKDCLLSMASSLQEGNHEYENNLRQFAQTCPCCSATPNHDVPYPSENECFHCRCYAVEATSSVKPRTSLRLPGVVLF